MRGLKGKTAIVTGGSEGIGAAIVTRFLEEGMRVGVMDLHPPKKGWKIDGDFHFKQCDISQDEEIEAAVAEIHAALGSASVLVNNAARFEFQDVDASRSVFEKICQVNIFGTSRVTHYVLPQIREQGGGSIINLSSVSGFVGQKGFATYTTTKFAIRGLTKAWAVDLGPERIRVNSIIPSCVKTDAFIKAAEDMGMTLDQALQKFGAYQVLNRIAEPEEIAAAAAFLASDDSSFITGSDLLVDGGYLASVEKSTRP